ncbi:Fe(2+) transporter permease subunit FeoB [Vibrio sp. SM6]|uniref:Ferrous iron transport protein B n=1 Tax=Vibrio agarilyticus TaxID=2726741 RepID=A0A7X8YFK1_9VIBR|nr:Fe(2+) transporter permease subunit FeoB [Vibrio agarilyticus]NLS12008.1 Fe(2+) transporter permease subunit FeoB [Vibrio agarilyticus]
MSHYHILTVGNPNSGKTTLFNALTGAKQQVGNWAGVTVEKKTGHFSSTGVEFELTDLPGLYALDSANDANSLDEAIASSAIYNLAADVIVNVVDATALERGLYMTLQLRELGKPMVVVLNKLDVLQKQHQVLDLAKLEKHLGCQVFALSAHDKDQVAEFVKRLHKSLAQGVHCEPLTLNYDARLEATLSELIQLPSLAHNDASRAEAVRILESDVLTLNRLTEHDRNAAENLRNLLSVEMDAELNIANTRYTFLHQVCTDVRRQEGGLSRKASDRIDNILLHRVAGLPIFFGIMYLMFMFAINVGGSFIDFFDIAVGAIAVDGVHHLLDNALPEWFVTIVADGFGAGIQTVATFIPVIAAMYLFLAVLESSGYMARAAFVLDRLMQKIGLPGKAFVPMIIGFGCSVPAVMATRTLEQERERKLTAAMVPFMSCGARLPVFALFAAAFFPENGQNVVFLLYLIGVLAAVITGLVLRHTLYPGTSDSLVMELPSYERPTLRNVLTKTWHKLKKFVLGSGKTIVVVVAILSFFNSLGVDGSFGNQESEKSVLSRASQIVTPMFEPIGVQENNWQATVGIITGLFAKEAVIGTLNSLYSSAEAGDETSEYDLIATLGEALQTIPDNLMGMNYSDPLGIEVGDLTDKAVVAEDQGVDNTIFGNLETHFVSGSAAFSYMLFVLLYTPCAAALGAFAREFGQPFMRFIAIWTFAFGYIVAAVFYQLTQISATPVYSVSVIALCVTLVVGVIARLKLKAKQQQTLIIMAE